MSGGRSPRNIQKGYTIVEVLIFLAVSGLMFVVAAGFVNGKQAKAEFRQGMNATNSQLREVINDVGNGYFPAGSSFRCEAGSSGSPGFPSGAANAQGENKGCVFMGKVIQFSADGDDKKINIYTIAGRQYKTTPESAIVPTSFAEAKPVAVPSLTESKKLQWGLTLIKASTPTSNLKGIGFFSSFGSYDSSGVLASGNQNVIVVPIVDTITESSVGSLITDSAVVSNPSITLCLENERGQFGTVTVGGTNQQSQRLATTIKVGNSASICP